MKKSSVNVGVEIWVKWQMHIWCEAEGSHRRYENAILLKGWNNEMWKGANTQGLTLIFQICFADDLGENWLPTRCHNWTKKIWRATSELGRSDTWNWMRGIIIHKRPSQRLSLLFLSSSSLAHLDSNFPKTKFVQSKLLYLRKKFSFMCKFVCRT